MGKGAGMNRFNIPVVLLLSAFLAACSTLPDYRPATKEPETRIRAGAGELFNEEAVKNAEVRQTYPLIDIVIPISKSKADLPVLTLEAVGQGMYSVSTGNMSLNVSEEFAGLALSHERGRVGLVANDTDYVITAEVYHQLTNLISVTGELQHRSAHEFDTRANRRKETKAGIGLQFRWHECWSTGFGYETGNSGKAGVRDSVFLDLVWRGC